ncbi:MAG: GNAT family N-acetyltransferase [Armatimonadota bacterium]
MTAPRLEGPRVHLRAMADSDFDAWFAIVSNPAAMRYWSCPAHTERDSARVVFDAIRPGDDEPDAVAWAIADATDMLVGTVALHRMDPANERAEVGYMLAPSLWGRGFASEAVGLVLSHAFGPLGLRRIEADTDPRNTASIRLLERLGFQREGLLRERWRVADEISDTALYGLLAREWRNLP